MPLSTAPLFKLWFLEPSRSGRVPGSSTVLVIIVVEELPLRRMLLSPHRVIELMVRQARVRTERIVHCALTEGLSEERRRILDGLLELKPDGDVTW